MHNRGHTWLRSYKTSFGLGPLSNLASNNHFKGFVAPRVQLCHPLISDNILSLQYR